MVTAVTFFFFEVGHLSFMQLCQLLRLKIFFAKKKKRGLHSNRILKCKIMKKNYIAYKLQWEGVNLSGFVHSHSSLTSFSVFFFFLLSQLNKIKFFIEKAHTETKREHLATPVQLLLVCIKI